jgi:hypothetical protein
MSEQIPLIEGVDPAARRVFDYYPTPAWMTLALLRRVLVHDVLECCSGEDAITNVLTSYPGYGDMRIRTWTNDLDPSRPAQTHLDATLPATWERLCPSPDRGNQPFWVVTNPPFEYADQIVPMAHKYVQNVAMVLRLSWLEPTAARQRFLSEHPPTRLIVMPRWDFKGRGSTDSVTSAWFIWESNQVARRGIDVVTKDERDELIAREGR